MCGAFLFPTAARRKTGTLPLLLALSGPPEMSDLRPQSESGEAARRHCRSAERQCGVFYQLHNSLGGGNAPQGGTEVVLVPLLVKDPPLTPDPALTPAPELDVDALLDP